MDALKLRLLERYQRSANLDDSEFPEALQDDRSFVLFAVLTDGGFLRFASAEVQADKRVVLAAVQRTGKALAFAAPHLRADPDVVLAAAGNDSEAVQFAAETLRRSAAFMQKCCSIGALPNRALKYCLGGLNADVQVVLAAVARDGWSLQFASPEMRKHRDVVMRAVAQKACGFRWAAEALRRDREVALTAVQFQQSSMKFVGAELVEDRDFALEAVRRNPLALEFASSKLRADEEVCRTAVAQTGQVLFKVRSQVILDEDFVKQAIRTDGFALSVAMQFHPVSTDLVRIAVHNKAAALLVAGEHRQDDESFVRSLILDTKNANILRFASPRLRNDRDLVLEALKVHDGSLASSEPMLRLLLEGPLAQDRDIVMRAVAHDGNMLGQAAELLRNDPEIAAAAVEQNGLALQHCSFRLKGDLSMVTAAMKQNPLAYQYASEASRRHPEHVRHLCESLNGQEYQEKIRHLVHPAMRVQIESWAAEQTGDDYQDLSFLELHARFIGCPVLEEDPRRGRFPDLGWYFRVTLQE